MPQPVIAALKHDSCVYLLRRVEIHKSLKKVGLVGQLFTNALGRTGIDFFETRPRIRLTVCLLYCATYGYKVRNRLPEKRTRFRI